MLQRQVAHPLPNGADMAGPYAYPHPMVAAAATLALFHRGRILLGKRCDTTSAYPGFWSLPGGFVEADLEEVEAAAVREIREELSISLDRRRLKLFHVSSRPGTDPRCHVVNVCYRAELTRAQARSVRAGDDLVALQFLTAAEALRLPLAFRHSDILAHAVRAKLREDTLRFAVLGLAAALAGTALLLYLLWG